MENVGILYFRSRTDNDPLIVECGMRLMNINEIDPVKFSFSVNVFYKFYWVDNRIQRTEPNLDQSHVLDQDFISEIWRPHFYTYDLLSYRLLGPDRKGLKIKKRYNNDTEIQYQVEAEVVFKCPINYSHFPFHSPTCKLRFTSPNHANTSIVFRHKIWPKYRTLDSSIEIQGYGFQVSPLTGKDTVVRSWSQKSWYSVVGLKIDLLSRHTKYMFLYFLPTTMLTMIS